MSLVDACVTLGKPLPPCPPSLQDSPGNRIESFRCIYLQEVSEVAVFARFKKLHVHGGIYHYLRHVSQPTARVRDQFVVKICRRIRGNVQGARDQIPRSPEALSEWGGRAVIFSRD
jgi:hypothetical protein